MRQIPVRIGIMLVMVAAVGTGCTKDPAAEGSQPASMAQNQQSPPQPRSETLVIPAGTNVVASLQTPLSTSTNQSGDSFTAQTVDAIVIDGRTVVPSGAQVHGVLRDVQASGKIKGRARMTLDFQQIEDSKGSSHSISAQPVTLQADSNTRGDVEKIAAGGVLGAIIGGIAGGKKGALIGAGAGAGAGTVVVLATKGDEVELGTGQRVNIYMTAPASIVLVAQR